MRNQVRMCVRSFSTIAGFVCLLMVLDVSAVEEPEGYRLDTYDDAVPETLRGAIRVNAIDVRKLQIDQDAVIVDVIPEHRKPDDLPKDQLWFPVAHEGVAGALWLPDVGYGVLSDTTQRYFQHHLQQATGSDKDKPIVFYCRIDCWMSWNASKRALSYGYRNVFWFADGIDDWKFEDLKTDILKPAPGARH